jgi:hypothetical protein
LPARAVCYAVVDLLTEFMCVQWLCTVLQSYYTYYSFFLYTIEPSSPLWSL